MQRLPYPTERVVHHNGTEILTVISIDGSIVCLDDYSSLPYLVDTFGDIYIQGEERFYIDINNGRVMPNVVRDIFGTQDSWPVADLVESVMADLYLALAINNGFHPDMDPMEMSKILDGE